MAVREKFGERGGALLRLLRFRDREKEKTALGYALNFALGLLLAVHGGTLAKYPPKARVKFR